ncbi:MAG: hypothetical protein ACJAYU_000222 [Bradymonadia bacterium]|jgi:hypothetical protein
MIRSAAVAALLVLTFAAPARSAETTFSGSVFVDMTAVPAAAGNAALMLALDVEGLARDSKFAAVLDTDTLRLSYENLRLAERVWFGVYGEGEVIFAALLPNYFQNGELIPERGFSAAYLGGGLDLTLSPHPEHWIRVGVAARNWFFSENANTSDALTLPPNQLITTPSLGYTYWGFREASDFSERQRVFPRVLGAAFGLQASVLLRGDDSAWGATDSSFEPVDTRNDPDGQSIRLRAWFLGGTWITNGIRWQFDHRAAFGIGEDDLSRDPVGATNRYVTPIAGMPWAALLSERYVSGQWSWHAPFTRSHEAGVMLGGAYVDDLERTGDSSSGAVFGGGGFVDLRFGDWQVDARVGWTPTLSTGEDSANGVSFAFGAGWGG